MKEGSENSGIGRENAEFQRLLAGAQCVQVKGGMLLLAAHPQENTDRQNRSGNLV